jgi:hypothetical protein
MGKRKTRKKPTKAKVDKNLPKSFHCPYCGQEGAISIEMFGFFLFDFSLLGPSSSATDL